ncbi:hypothetical protein Thena_0489 [Thermodesulfobium narugense DSM 14796]|uniref:AMIN domain-containing protein n=1 Tax=Thermodesulfobium narugense DSM 14796 TaxID=747365 RepID=M1E7S9_9BACT|nr:AMIN domain-containing protein [Thermodesulfobium narugense]AEE14129.1 hypothetical protein Thena_0489 [Thermodesulfobium narugense DSM 14796]
MYKVKGFVVLLFLLTFTLFSTSLANASIFSQIFGSKDTKSSSIQTQNTTSTDSSNADFQKWNSEVDNLLNSLSSNNQTSTNNSSKAASTNVKSNSSASIPTNTSNKQEETKQNTSVKAVNNPTSTGAQNNNSSSTGVPLNSAGCVKITDGEYPPVNLMKDQFIDNVKLFNDGTKVVLLLESTVPFTQADIKQYAFPDQVIIDIPNIFLDKSVKTGQFNPQGLNYVNMVRIQNFDSDILKSSRIVLTFPDAPKYTVLKTDDPKKLEIAFEVPSLESTLKKNEKTSQDTNVNSLNTAANTSVSSGKN